jgi:hypothetical protein
LDRICRPFFFGRVEEVLSNTRYRLHVLTSHGRGLLAREGGWRTALGYGGAFASNLLARRALGGWLERVVFSSQTGDPQGAVARLPFDGSDFPTRQVVLNTTNFHAAVQASCSIPFVLQAVHDIADAPRGAYWDGGVTDYHLHLNYASRSNAMQSVAMNNYLISTTGTNCLSNSAALVLYPHFQKNVVPGWLDKHLRWRHRATPFLDNMVLLAPSTEWITTLPRANCLIAPTSPTMGLTWPHGSRPGTVQWRPANNWRTNLPPGCIGPTCPLCGHFKPVPCLILRLSQ